MTDLVSVQTDNGVVCTCGTLLRPTHPAEAKHFLTSVEPPPVGADLARPISLSPFTLGYDPRPDEIFYQGRIGSCAACASCTAAYIAMFIGLVKSGMTPEQARLVLRKLHPGWCYQKARQRHPEWGYDDTGSYVADNLDELMLGAPRLDLHPYVEDAKFVYPASLDDDRVNQDYVLSHHLLSPREPLFMERLWDGIAQGWPYIISTGWPGSWFGTRDGWLEDVEQVSPNEPGHAICGYSLLPPGALAATAGAPFINSWSDGWPNSPGRGFDMRPGEGIMPMRQFTNGRIWEVRFVKFQPVEVIVDPNPEPQPEPTVDTFPVSELASALAGYEQTGTDEVNRAKGHAKYVARLHRDGARGLAGDLRARFRLAVAGGR